MKTRKSAMIVIGCLVVLSLAFVASARPPTWAPAYGLRNKTYQYVYRYYPNAEVYFDTARNRYFYEVNGEWVQTATLEADIQQRLNEFVTVAMDTQTPYDMHQEIAAAYAPALVGNVSDARKLVEVPKQTPLPQQPEEQLAAYQYRYYPDADVYRDAARSLYFYQIDMQWFQAPTLPAELAQRLAEFVQITLRTQNPVEFNQHVTQVYPSLRTGQAEAPASRQYLYYPDANVYFAPDRELYFYYADGRWVKAPTLLSALQSRLNDFVTLNLTTDAPYEFQEAISVLYPPSQAAKMIERDEPVPQPEQQAQQAQKVVYVYYYDQSVYFDPARAMYFYLRDDTWQHVTTLPDSITINREQFVNVELNTLTPYTYHQSILKHYPPGQAKKMAEPENVKEKNPKNDKKDREKESKPPKDKKHEK